MTPVLPRRTAPVWVMGLTNALFGMYGGVLVITIPQLLNARQVPEATISSMTAVMISPGFWTFLVSPILDVRFSRRWYSLMTAVAAAILLFLAILNLDSPATVEILLVSGFFFANLYQSALGGWLSSITAPNEQKKLSIWVTIANISGGGAMAVAAGELAVRLPRQATATLLGLIVLLPTAIFAWMPAPGPDRRLARESFARLLNEVVRLVQLPQILIALLLFIAPAATFSLVNLLSGLGSDFHASTHFVGLVGGGGVLIAGIAGCLLFALVDRLMPLRFLYLTIGLVGSAFTMLLLLLPRTPGSFAVALIGENVFQSLAITASTAIAFETIGRGNPLAATTYSLLICAFNVANTYMLVIDGWGYAWRGITGSYLVDAGASIVASLMLMWLLTRRAVRGAGLARQDA